MCTMIARFANLLTYFYSSEKGTEGTTALLGGAQQRLLHLVLARNKKTCRAHLITQKESLKKKPQRRKQQGMYTWLTDWQKTLSNTHTYQN